MFFLSRSVNTSKAYSKLMAVIGSRKFFWVIIGLFVLQALWLAFSFLYPSPYDEKFHLGVIQFYSHQYSPIITSQAPQYDYLRDLVHESSHFYHYLMSFPYRLIAAFTDNLNLQVLFLRVINIAFATGGLIIYSKLFRETGFKQKFINIALLIFILLPVVPQISSVVNYDNMLLLLTGLYLLLSVRLLKSAKPDWQLYILVLTVGLLASLVKYTFLPIFAASILYIGVFDKLKRPKGYFKELVTSIKQAKRKQLAVYGVLLALLSGLFAQVYIQNVIRYGRPQPECQKTMSQERCLKSDIVTRNLNAEKNKEQRPLISLPQYFQLWLTNMNISTDFTIATTTSGPRDRADALPIIYFFTYFAALIGLALLLYSWQVLDKNTAWYYLLAMVVALAAAVFADNYRVYRQTHLGLAIQPRYLLSVLPILLVMIVTAANHTFRRLPQIKLAGLIVGLFMLSQGGGAITHILRSKDNWYWQKTPVIKANHLAKKVLNPLVKE